MPYTKSRARKAFDYEADKALTVVRAAHSSARKSDEIREYVLCNAMVLCSANIESYIEDIIGDWAKQINKLAITTKKLPKSLRAFLAGSPEIVDLYKNFIVKEDEAELIRKLSSTFGRPCHHFAIDGLQVPSLNGKSLYSGKKYPSPKNMKQLFSRLGIPKIFDDLNKSSKSNIEATLTSFNDVRSEIAHGGIPSTINEKDIKRHINNIKKIIYHLDKIMYKHVCAFTGQSTWSV